MITREGRVLNEVHSNNEVEHAALKYGLEKCLDQGFSRLIIKGDSLLIVKQINGVWACKSESLLKWLQQVMDLLRGIGETQIIHIPRELNKETDALANEQLEEIVLAGIKFQCPKMQGAKDLEDVKHFLLTRECPQHLDKV